MGIIYLTPHPAECSSEPADGASVPNAGAPEIDPNYAAALVTDALAVEEPELRHGYYPRAHPLAVFGRTGGMDIAFVFDRQWRRLPDTAFHHAAVEVGIECGKSIEAEDYASGAAFFLTALRRSGWTVEPPTEPDPMIYKPRSDT